MNANNSQTVTTQVAQAAQAPAQEVKTYTFPVSTGVNQNGNTYKRYELARVFSSMPGSSFDVSGFWNGPGDNHRTAIFNAMGSLGPDGRNRRFLEQFVASNSQVSRVKDQLTGQNVAVRRITIAGYIGPDPRAGRQRIIPTAGRAFDFRETLESMGGVSELAGVVVDYLRQKLYAAVPKDAQTGDPADAPAQTTREQLVGLIPGVEVPETSAPF
jgi:hypothetical protein